jgi:two-component system nitrate/nitrite response regulator NarL
MQVEEPLIVENLSTETRFEPSELIREHGIVSGISVVIHGQEEPVEVLSAYTTSRRIFTEDDANFLQAVANVLATAIQHKEAEDSLEEVREAERSRIARDLHDDALQDLTNALVKVQLVQSISKDPEVSRQLGQLLAVLDRIGPHLRGAIYDLRLEAEQERPFSELLESLVELQHTMAPEYEIRLQVGDGLLEEPLGKRGREVLRIVGEALTNARRHSRARNVLVSVRTEQGKLSVEVSDDGRGFHPEKEPSATPTATGGTGIKGMRERARALGADLKIQSEPGRGTKVRLTLALKKERDQPEEEAVRVLLVEDHTAVRESLASTFEREAGFNVVGQAESLAEARQMLHEAEPVDVAVVDLGLPDGYGADLIKELREASPQAQALVLSASLDRAEIARAVERGAAGVLHKTTHLDEVVEAVLRLRAGETLLPIEEVVELLRFASTRREEEYEARIAIARLTSREIEVLQVLAEGLDGERIAERLHISLRTERNHMSNILAKLGVHSQLQALVFALRYGVVEIP